MSLGTARCRSSPDPLPCAGKLRGLDASKPATSRTTQAARPKRVHRELEQAALEVTLSAPAPSVALVDRASYGPNMGLAMRQAARDESTSTIHRASRPIKTTLPGS